jgi:hypothetical protein
MAGMTLELTEDQQRDLARTVRNAVRAKVRLWNSLREAELILGRDIDDFENLIEQIAVGVDSDYTLGEAREVAAELIKESDGSDDVCGQKPKADRDRPTSTGPCHAYPS